MRTVWAYARVSTTKDEQELSLEEQERWARSHADKLGADLRVFREKASAKTTVGRKVFQGMMAELTDLAAVKRPAQVVVTAWDRLSRDMLDAQLTVRTLRQLKVEL